MIKVNRNGKSATLNEAQLDGLLIAAPASHWRCLWAIQRWSAARISEALSLTWADLAGGCVTFRASTTKTKATRQLRQTPRLAKEIATYQAAWTETHGRAPKSTDFLFPAPNRPGEPMTRQAADKIFRNTCAALGIVGASLHSFRRSTATAALAAGLSLPVVQKITGHKSLQSLGEYLEPSPEEVAAGLAGLWG